VRAIAFALLVTSAPASAGERERILAFVDETVMWDGPAGGLTKVKRVTPPPRKLNGKREARHP
jgi:hypothetical protein